MALALQRRLARAADEGCFDFHAQRIHALAFFDGLTLIWSLLDDSAVSESVWKLIGLDTPQTAGAARRGRFGGFERHSVERRSRLLPGAAALLAQGADGLGELMQRAGLSIEGVTRSSGRGVATVPFWLATILRFHVDRSVYVPTDDEINNAIGYLRRLGRIPSPSEVCKALGMRTTSSARVASHVRCSVAGDVDTRSTPP
jgi:hypothetical protein